MNKTDILYGLHGSEQLFESVRELVSDRVDCCGSEEGWPVEVVEYKRMTIPESWAEAFAEGCLESALCDLDCDYGDENGDYTQPTERMKQAALALAKVILDEYVPWQCEPTGKVVTVTKEKAKAMLSIDSCYATCTGCGEVKHKDEFPSDPSVPGLCADCDNV